MSSVTEFAVTAEVCTATVHLETPTGEAYSGPLHIGYYPAQDVEVWIEQDGQRVQFSGRHFDAVIKQLKRAQKLAQHLAKEQP
jgi:hypothetical protein